MPAAKDNKHDWRGSVEDPPEPRFLVIGQIVKPHGVRGEMRVMPHTDEPKRFTWLETVYVGEEDPQPVDVAGVRYHQNQILLKLAGCDDRETAELWRGTWLQVPEDEALPLEEGEYFLFQLLGLQVFGDDDEHLGELVDVIETQANNVFVINGADGELLLPDIAEVVQDIDFENGRMVVHVLPGLR